MTAIADLIAAARDESQLGEWTDSKARLADLADAAEKELEELRPKLVGESFFMPTWTKLSPKDAKAYAEYRRSQFKPLEPRIDLEALRKALTIYFSPHLPYKEWVASVDQLRSLLAQLESAKADEERRIVDEMMAERPKPEVRKAGPKPEAQTCVDPTCTRHHFDQCGEDCVLLRKTRGKCYHEAQTCGGCAGRGGEHSATGVSTCQQCNGTGKVGGGK